MTTEIRQEWKAAPAIGVTPAILLINPKYPHNVGAAVRGASCFGLRQVWFTGDRVSLNPHPGYRLPREERMKGFRDVELRQYDRPFDAFPGAVPVAVEVRDGAQLLPTFVHPEKALYVFGPEDGGLTRVTLQHCHSVVFIPARHCFNLAASIHVVLYDRYVKRVAQGLEPLLPVSEALREDRGFIEVWSRDGRSNRERDE